MTMRFFSRRQSFLLSLIAASFSIASCTANINNNSENLSLVGAGASFPAPLYQRWTSVYSQKTPNVRISYQSVGSGAGVQQFTKGTVDFAASDVAITPKEAAQVERGVIALPMTAGAIVLAYNLPNLATGLNPL